jgi:rod shape determining protein RodA
LASFAVPRRTDIARSDLDPGAAWRHVDWWIVTTVSLMSIMGGAMVFSATRLRGVVPPAENTYYLERQSLFVVIGLGVMAFAAAIDYRRLRELSPLFYGATVFLLAAVLTPLGSNRKGAQAWFTLPGGFQLQPSEFAKITLILMFASFCSSRRASDDPIDMGPRRFVQALIVAGAPLFLLLLQPDLGTGLVFGAITIGVLAVSGAKARYLFLLGLLVVLAGAAILRGGFLQDYQKDRLTSFLNPTADVQGPAFNLNQSKIAIGSGGFLGKGFKHGTQTKLRYVPEQHTDFIFSVVGEELGLVGAGGLLGLFALLMWRIWKAAMEANDQTGTLICVGVLAMLVFQIFENVGMTMGIMPITGIPLPFLSYGGSSTLACFAGAGLVLNVRMRRYS